MSGGQDTESAADMSSLCNCKGVCCASSCNFCSCMTLNDAGWSQQRGGLLRQQSSIPFLTLLLLEEGRRLTCASSWSEAHSSCMRSSSSSMSCSCCSAATPDATQLYRRSAAVRQRQLQHGCTTQQSCSAATTNAIQLYTAVTLLSNSMQYNISPLILRAI